MNTTPSTSASQPTTSTPPKATAVIRKARAGDLASIERLLVENGLPTTGVAEALGGFLVAEHGGAVVGVVGVEEVGGYGLLRSTAVSGEWRSRGLGRQLVERAIAQSEARGVKALYLLTTTAERYFPSFGFTVVERADVPDPLRTTGEFSAACPDSATVMARELGAP